MDTRHRHKGIPIVTTVEQALLSTKSPAERALWLEGVTRAFAIHVDRIRGDADEKTGVDGIAEEARKYAEPFLPK